MEILGEGSSPALTKLAKLQLLAGDDWLQHSDSLTKYKEEIGAEIRSVYTQALRSTVFRNIWGIMIKYCIVLGRI